MMLGLRKTNRNGWFKKLIIYFTIVFLNFCPYLVPNQITVYALGILLYLLYLLDATLRHLHSPEFCSFGSIPLVKTVALMFSLLS